MMQKDQKKSILQLVNKNALKSKGAKGIRISHESLREENKSLSCHGSEIC